MTKTAIEHLSKDPLLRDVFSVVKLPESKSSQDVYNSLLQSIVSQQLSVKAAATIYRRFLDAFPNKNPLPTALLAKNLEELRAVGLSKQKSGYMQNIAQFALDNQFEQIDWTTYSDEEIINLLTQIKGVGTWTVQMTLMFTLERTDVFPNEDLGIQQAMQKLYGIEGKGNVLIAKMNQLAEPWRPYRSIACRYLWKWKDL